MIGARVCALPSDLFSICDHAATAVTTPITATTPATVDDGLQTTITDCARLEELLRFPSM